MKKIEVDEYELDAIMRGCTFARRQLAAVAEVLARVLRQHPHSATARLVVPAVADALHRVDTRLRAALSWLRVLEYRLSWAEEVSEDDD